MYYHFNLNNLLGHSWKPARVRHRVHRPDGHWPSVLHVPSRCDFGRLALHFVVLQHRLESDHLFHVRQSFHCDGHANTAQAGFVHGYGNIYKLTLNIKFKY